MSGQEASHVRYRLHDTAALLAALVVPLLVALALVPFRTDLSATNAALILVVTVVAVASLGTRVAGALASLSAAAWFDFFLTEPYQRFLIAGPGRVTEYAGWPDGETELRVVGGGHYYGRFLLDPLPGPLPRNRTAWWPSHWPPRPTPPWTRPACPTRADRLTRLFPALHVRAALRVPVRPYGPRQGVLTPG